MYVRCVDCRRATWTEPVEPGSSIEVICAGCGRNYALKGSRQLGSGAREQFRKALEHANRHNLDLPCSWSVLAGLMTLRQAHACRIDMGIETPDGSSGWAGRPTTASPRPTRDALAPSEDEATDAGERRRAEARRIAERNDLPIRLATRVANGELTLPAARMLRSTLLHPARQPPHEDAVAETSPPPEAKRPVPIRSIAAISGVLVLIATLWVGWPRSEAVGDPPAERLLPEGMEILRDAEGHAVEIAGPDPESVLIAYCSGDSPSVRCQPLKLTMGSPPRAGLRLGVFRKAGGGDALHAIEIRRQGGARRWATGDGETRIRSVASPDQPPGAAEVPLPTR